MNFLIIILVVFNLPLFNLSVLGQAPTNTDQKIREMATRARLLNGVFYSKYAIGFVETPSPVPSSPVEAGLPTSQADFAQEAQALLDGGAGWGELSDAQKEGYANVFPSLAVGAGGAAALNLMDPSLLTPEIVAGFALASGEWVEPVVQGARADNLSLNSTDPSWSGWGQPFPVVRIFDPLLEGEIIGWVLPHLTTYTLTTSGLQNNENGDWVPTTGQEDGAHVYYTHVLNPTSASVTTSGDGTSSQPTFMSGGGGGGVNYTGGSPVPTGSPLTSEVVFSSGIGGTIMILPTREGTVLPTPAPTATPRPGGMSIGGWGR